MKDQAKCDLIDSKLWILCALIYDYNMCAVIKELKRESVVAPILLSRLDYGVIVPRNLYPSPVK